MKTLPRARRRRMRRHMLAVLSALFVGSAAHVASAGSSDTLHDVRGYFSYMANVQEEIRNYRAAKEAVKQAQLDLAAARQNLDDAGAARSEAAENLAQAGVRLKAAEDRLAAVRAALAAAEAESAKRTEEAIAAQQAEADYAPAVARERAAVDALNMRMNTLTGEGSGNGRNAAREEVVARILEEIAYQQNRLVEAQAMVDAALAGNGADSAAYDAELAALSAKLDAAQASLDSVQAQLDALTEAREAAEQAEADARSLVADYRQELADSENDVVQSAHDKAEAEKFDAEAQAWLAGATQDEAQAAKGLSDTEYELAHFGEGRSVQLGALEYYHWSGERSGHQLYMPLSYFERTSIGRRQLDFELSTGYVRSDTGFPDGGVSGWTDTSLSAVIRNEKKVNSVRYGFAVNVPTGQPRFSERSLVPEGLARFTDFGAGWQFIPSIEAVHRFAERDMLTGRLRYAFRGGYEYAREVPGARVSPGDIFSQELEYLHAGEKKAYMVQLYHSSTTSAVQDTVDTRARMITGRTNYRDGDEWELRYFYDRMVSPADAVRCYAIFAWTEAGTSDGASSVQRQYYGAGLRHRMTARADWSLMAHYSKVSSTYDPLRVSLDTGGGFRRMSLAAELNWRPDEKRSLSFQLERYVRDDDGGGGYNGWGTTLWYQKTL